MTCQIDSITLLHLKTEFLLLHTRNVGGKYVFVKDDKIFDKLIYQVLILNLIFMVWNGYQRRAEADGKIVGVHHVFVTENMKTVSYSAFLQMCSGRMFKTIYIVWHLLPEFRKMVQECKQITHHHKDWTRPCLDHVSYLHHKFMFGFQL